MAIRITGMYSGLDTESIINELASAQSYKKNKLVKAQTKLSWKQDAWKSLNTKIYSFYQKLDDLRLQASYKKKKTVVSNTNAIKVTGGEVDGSHKVSVKQLSTVASLTSGKINADKNYGYRGNATLKQLGFEGKGSIRVTDVDGGYVNIDVDENMTINDFVDTMKNKAGLTASFDQDNQRIYLSSWTSGEVGEFTLTGNDEKGLEALKALKLLSTDELAKLTAAGTDGAKGGDYAIWSKYRENDINGAISSDYQKVIEKETLARLKKMKEQNDQLAKENEDYEKANKNNVDMLKKIQSNADGKYNDYTGYVDSSYDFGTMTPADVRAAGKKLYDQIYGEEKEQKIQAKDDDGNLLFESDGTTPKYVQAKDEKGDPKVDEFNQPVYETETVRTGGMTQELEKLQKDLSDKQEALKNARKAFEDGSGTEQAVKDAEKKVADASKAVSDQQAKIDKAKEVYSFYEAYNYNDDKKTANEKTMAANSERFTYKKNDDGTETYMEKVEDSGNPGTLKEVAVGQGTTAKEVTAEFDKRVEIAQKVMKDVRNDDGTLKSAKDSTWLGSATGTKVKGQDAEIMMDGVTYQASNDTVTVNGLTITALEQTDKDVTISTKDDTEGVYNMIKDFIKSYSELINEMDSLYNAESAKDYEPLLTEEKEALTETEIEEWEKKIKDSLLRRDSTLSNVSSALKMDMMKGFSIGGQTVYLSDFGINTLGYFNAAENEKNAYHIDGDPDDAKTKNNTDLLNSLISKNPDAVMEFFTGLTNTLHDTLAEKMSATKMSSAMTVYNDKKMKEEYDDYTKSIKKQEEKLNAYIDKWYSKFSAMETALAKLESKNNSLSSLFGG